MKTTFQVFAPILRRMGFKRQWISRAGGEKCIEYRRVNDDCRALDVQLWASGNHRISHWIGGVMDTKPTGFASHEELIAAVQHESSRTDNKRYKAPSAN